MHAIWQLLRLFYVTRGTKPHWLWLLSAVSALPGDSASTWFDASLFVFTPTLGVG